MSVRYNPAERRSFIGGSGARFIMGDDEAALLQLWCEKRGEAEPEDLSGNLIVQLGLATEALNRNCYERKTGQVIECVQHRLRHPVLQWMGATLDGNGRRQRGGVRGQVHAAVVVFRGRGGREAHGVWVTNSKAAALSVITGGGKWVEIAITADSLDQHLLLAAEKKFWRCVETGEPTRLFCVEPPLPRIAAVRSVAMTSSNDCGPSLLAPNPGGFSKARECRGRTQGPDAGRRQRGHRAWHSGQALEIRSRDSTS